jgi:non-specific protein-tyrosine kinase
MASQRLAETYQQLVTTSPMRERVAATLGIEEVDSELSTSVVENTQLIHVTVVDENPEMAALIANTLVAEFQGYIAGQVSSRAESTRSGLDEQIATLQQREQELSAQITELDTSENADNQQIQRQISDLTEERSGVNDSLNDLNAEASSIDAQLAAASAQIEMADPAEAPETPVEPRPVLALALGLFVGLLLGVAVIALLEFLDNTVKPETNVQTLVGAPVLASVSALARLDSGGRQVYTLSQPQSAAAEAIRLLRTNLEFAAASSSIASVTITSAGPGEGKSTTVANLGVVMAQGGQAVAILDADLRRPTQHRIFGVENTSGLTTLLTHPDQAWQTVARKVALPGLFLVPCGPVPPNPSDLLSSSRFESILERIKSEVDLVIIDSPPILAASDALAIATHTDGVVLVCQSHRTRIDAFRHAASSVQQGGMRLVGVVLNRQKAKEGALYYGEYYSSTAPAGSD